MEADYTKWRLPIMLSKKPGLAKKTYLALSLTTALVAASQPTHVHASQDESFGSKIVDAAEIGDAEQVLSLLERGINPNERGQFGTSALLRAANSGDLEIAKILIENGANANVSDIGGATALHIAARKGDAAFVNFLLSNKANANAEDNEGNTPLMLSAISNSSAVAGILIKSGADLDATNSSGENALHYATEEGAEKVADILIATGARRDIIDEEGYTAVEVAARKSNSLLVAKLDSKNPDHVVISMGRGFRSTSASEKAKKATEASRGKELIQELASNEAIVLENVEYIDNPNDPELRFFDSNRFAPASGEQQLASAPKKSWLNGLSEAFQEAGAFELASVQNFKEGGKYALIELGSFKLRAFAEKRISELKIENPEVLSDVSLSIFERSVGEDVEYYINGGVFEELSEAENICKQLSANGVRCSAVESALLSDQDFASFGDSAKSSFSAAKVEPVELPEIAEVAIPELPVIKTPETDVFQVSKKEELKEIPQVILKKEAPKTPEIVAIPDLEEETSLTELAGMSEENQDSLPEIATISEIEAATEEEESAPLSIDDLVDSIYKEKEQEVVVPVQKKAVALAEVQEIPAALLETTKPTPVATTQKIEEIEEVRQQIEALPELPLKNDDFASFESKPDLKITFAEPKVLNSDTLKTSIAASKTPQKITIANDSSRKPSLVNSVKLVDAPESKPVAKPEVFKAPKVAPTPAADKFVVAKPVRVNDSYQAPTTYAPATTASAPKITYSDAYTPNTNSLSRKESRRIAKVEHFETADSAMGLYWKYRENGVLDDSITVRAARDLAGKPYYSSIIGEFRTNNAAQAFCNEVYAAEKLRCSVMDEISYTSRPKATGKSRGYKRHSSR